MWRNSGSAGGLLGSAKEMGSSSLRITNADLHQSTRLLRCTIDTDDTRPCTYKIRVFYCQNELLGRQRAVDDPSNLAMAILGTALNGIGALFLTHAYVRP
jgi:hypothetical protein